MVFAMGQCSLSHGHSPSAHLFEYNYSYSCAAADIISTDTARHLILLY